MNDDNSIFSHMKSAAILNKVTTDPCAVWHHDAFADDRMPNLRVLPYAHTGHQNRS